MTRKCKNASLHPRTPATYITSSPIPPRSMHSAGFWFLIVVLLAGCAGGIQLEVTAFRASEATAAVPPTGSIEPPPGVTVPAEVETPAPIGTTEGGQLPPNAIPPPTGMLVFPPGVTLAATTIRMPPPTPEYVGTAAPCIAYNRARTPLLIRESAGVESDVIGIWDAARAAAALGRIDDWVLVQLGDGAVGWVFEDSVSLVGTCALAMPLPTLTMTMDAECRASSATGAGTNLYNAPSASAGVVGVMPNGYLMAAAQRTAGGWILLVDERGRLPRGSNAGWAFESALNLNGACGGLPVVTPVALTTLTPVALAASPPLDVCSILNRSAASIPILNEPSASAFIVGALSPGEIGRVIGRTANNWYAVEAAVGIVGYVDGREAELFGDCVGIALSESRYTPAPDLIAGDLRDCRLLIVLENALLEIGGLNVPLDAGREYPIVRAEAGRYIILIGDGVGGSVEASAGILRGDCGRLDR
jgi:uncharacterized protein YgiM (DUF1202 family)